MKPAEPLTLIICAVGIFLLVSLLGGQVLLYSPEGNSVTYDHMDASTIRPMTTEESETLLPLMDELLMLSNNVVLEIRADDPESALRTIQAYERSLSRMNTNSIKVKVTGTDINEFRKEASKLKDEIKSLLNNTERVKELQKLSIQYSDENNPGAVYELSYEGEVLQREINKLAGQMLQSSTTMGDIAGRYDRDNSSIGTTHEALTDIRDSTGKIIEGFGPAVSVDRPEGHIEFDITPKTAYYGDTIYFSGIAKFVPQTLSFYMDLKGWKVVTADTSGHFNESLKIQKLSSGEHSVFILSGGVYSWLDTFTVLESPGYLNITDIEKSSGTNGTVVTVSGSLTTTNEVPVQNAVVNVYDENEGVIIGNANTNSKGVWRANIELSDGEYELFAAFDDSAFPITEARSETVLVHVGTPEYYYILILLIGGILVILGFRYVQRLSTKGKPEVNLRVPTITKDFAEKYIPKRMKKFFVPKSPEVDPDEIRQIYRGTIEAVAKKEGVAILGQTPREFLARTQIPVPELGRFIKMYEHLHYADVSIETTDIKQFEKLSEKIIHDLHEVEG